MLVFTIINHRKRNQLNALNEFVDFIPFFKPTCIQILLLLLILLRKRIMAQIFQILMYGMEWTRVVS